MRFIEAVKLLRAAWQARIAAAVALGTASRSTQGSRRIGSRTTLPATTSRSIRNWRASVVRRRKLCTRPRPDPPTTAFLGIRLGFLKRGADLRCQVIDVLFGEV